MRLFASLIGLLLPLINAQTPGYDWNGFTATTLGCGTDSSALNVGLSQTLSAGATGLKVKQIAFAIYGTNAMPPNIQLNGNPSTSRLSTSGIQACCAPNCDLAVQVAAAGQSWYNSPCGTNSCGGSSSQNKWYYMDFSSSAVGTIEQTGIGDALFYNGGGSQIGANMINLGSGSVFFMSYTEIIPSRSVTPSVTKSPVSPSLTSSETPSNSIDPTNTASSTGSRSVSASVSTDRTDSRSPSVTASISRSESLSRTNSRSESASVANSRSESASVSGTRASSSSVTVSRSPSVSFSTSKTVSATATKTSTGVCSDARTYFDGVWVTVVDATATYHVRHWVNVTHDLTPPDEKFIGANPTCTQTSTSCTCVYTGGDNTGGCTINRYASITYTYGASQTTTYVTQSPLCAYFFASTIFIPSATPSVTVSSSTSRSTTHSSTVSRSTTHSSSVSGTNAPSVSVTVTPTVTPYLPWFQGLVGCCHNSIDTAILALNVLPPYPYVNMGINRISFQYWPLAAGTATFTIALMDVAGGSMPGGFILASKTFSVTSPGSFPTYSQQVVTLTDLDPISSYVLGGDVEYALAFYGATPGIIDIVVGDPSVSFPSFWNDLMTESTGTFYTVGETNPPEVTNWLQSSNISFVAVGAGSALSSSPSLSPSVTGSSSLSSSTSLSSSLSSSTSLSSSMSPSVASPSETPSETGSSSLSASTTISSSISRSIAASPSFSRSTTRTPTATPSVAPNLNFNVITIAGMGNVVQADGIGTAASVPFPQYMAFTPDYTGIYISEASNADQIRLLNLTTNEVISIAGTWNVQATGNGIGTNAAMNNPAGVALDAPNNILYVVEKDANLVRSINLTDSTLQWIVGDPSSGPGAQDGVGTNALFRSPTGLAIDQPNQFLYVTDTGNNAIRAVNISSQNVTTVAGQLGMPGWRESYGIGQPGKFWSPVGISYSNLNMYVSDIYWNNIRVVYLFSPGLIGSSQNILGGNGPPNTSIDGSGTGVTFNNPMDLEYDSANNALYVSQIGTNQNVIRRINLNSMWNANVYTLIGNNITQSIDGIGTQVSFNNPIGIVYNPLANYLYVADSAGNKIRRIDLTATLSTPSVSASASVSTSVSTSTAPSVSLSSTISMTSSSSATTSLSATMSSSASVSAVASTTVTATSSSSASASTAPSSSATMSSSASVSAVASTTVTATSSSSASASAAPSSSVSASTAPTSSASLSPAGSSSVSASTAPSLSISVSVSVSPSTPPSSTITPSVTQTLPPPWFTGMVGCCHNSMTRGQAVSFMVPSPYILTGISSIALQYWPAAAGDTTFTIGLMAANAAYQPTGPVLASAVITLTSPGSFPTVQQQSVLLTNLGEIIAYPLAGGGWYSLVFYGASNSNVEFLVGNTGTYVFGGGLTPIAGSLYTTSTTSPPLSVFWFTSTNTAFLQIYTGPVQSMSASPTVSPSGTTMASSSVSVTQTTSSSTTVSSSPSSSTSLSITKSTSPSISSTISSSTSLSFTSTISSSTSPSVSSSTSPSSTSGISSSTSPSLTSTISSSTSLSSTSGISSSTSPSSTSDISSSTSPSVTSTISSSTSPSISSPSSLSSSSSVSSLVISSVSSSISSSVSSSVSSSISSSSSSSVTSSRTSAVTVSISASMSVLGISNSPLFLMSNASVSPTQNATGGNTIIVNDSSNNNLATILAGTALGSVLLLILSFIASRFGLSIPGLNGTKRTTTKDGTNPDAPDNPDAPVDGDGKKPDGVAMTALTGVVGTLFGKKGTDMLNSAKTLARDPNSLLPESAQNLLKQAGIDPNKIANDLENKASAKLQKAVGLTSVDAKDVTDVPDVEKGEVKSTSNQNKISTPATKVLTPSTQTKSFSQNKTSITSSELSSQPSSVKVSISTTPATQAKPVIVSLPSINENKSLDSLESPVYTPGTIITDLNTIISPPKSSVITQSSNQPVVIKPIESTINNDAITFSPEIKQFLQKILQPYASESDAVVPTESTTKSAVVPAEPTNNNKLKSNKVEIEPVGVSTIINVENDNKSKQQNNNKSPQNNNKSQQNNNKLQQNNKPDTNSNKSILQPTNNNKNKNEKPKVKLEINAEELAEIRQILSKRNKNYKVIK